QLGHVLFGDDDFVDPVLHVHGGDAALEVGLHLLLVTAVRVDDVPLTGTVIRALDGSAELFVLVALFVRRLGRLGRVLFEQLLGRDHLGVFGDVADQIGLIVVDDLNGRDDVFGRGDDVFDAGLVVAVVVVREVGEVRHG